MAAQAAKASSSVSKSLENRAGIRPLREMNACLIFTGLQSFGEHKYWCGPLSNFTRRICTPSMLKVWYCFAERLIILDRGHPAQTHGCVPLTGHLVFSQSFSNA